MKENFAACLCLPFSPHHKLKQLLQDCWVSMHACCCRKEAAKDAAAEPLLSSFLYASILSHDSFNQCLAFVLANRLSDATMLATEYYEIFLNVLSENEEIGQAALDDVQAVRERVWPHQMANLTIIGVLMTTAIVQSNPWR